MTLHIKRKRAGVGSAEWSENRAKIAITFERETFDAVRKTATKEGTSIAAIVRRIVKQHYAPEA